MELPQSRLFKAQDNPIFKYYQWREPTHDFLSLCSNSTLQTEPKPTPSRQSSHLKTHDFLQPLECVGGGAKAETSKTDTTSITSDPPAQLQHVLPGGIGTYTISSIPYFHNHQRIPKPELSPPMMFTAGGNVERNVVDAATVAGGFTLWDESGSGNKGQTRKENNAVERGDVATTTMGQWPVVEGRSRSLTNNNPLSGFSSRSSSQGSGLKSQSFMDMIRSAKGTSQDDDLDDDEDFIMKKESPSTSQNHRDLRVKASNDPKLNTPRSKHSATEQRRRSKINDRFQMLRQLIPNSDQKRDKASFLLEVIEYIQFLQEKTSKYDTTPYQGWNPEPAKLLNWQRKNQQLGTEGTVAFAPKLEEEKNNVPVLATAETLNRATPFPLSVQSNSLFSPVIAGHLASLETAEPNPSSRSHTQPLKEEEEKGDDEEGREGNISISSVYSQGLVKRLREALEKSGVDLTKTSISVEIELAKQLSSFKNHEVCDPVSRTGNDKQTRKPKRLKTYNTS